MGMIQEWTMEQTMLLIRAINFAAEKHAGQTRSGSDTPYINHPLRVMEIVSHSDSNESTLIAAVLHDVVEDTETTYEELREFLPEYIVSTIIELTDPPGLPKAERRGLQVKRLRNGSTTAKQIKIADKISNCEDLLYKESGWEGRKIWEYFKFSKELVDAVNLPTNGLTKQFNILYGEAQTRYEEAYRA